jgi:hypothetical protein
MSEHIAIIDPDPLLSKSIQDRLHKSFPDLHFQIYSPDECLMKESGSLTADMVFYDRNALNEESLRSLLQNDSIELIPLNAEGFPPRKKNAIELSACLSRAEHNRVNAETGLHRPSYIKSAFENEPSLITAANQNNSSRILLSFTDPARRESYISGCVRNMTKDGHRLIRVDLMPGVSMRNPFRKRSDFRDHNSFSSTGISEVLLKLESTSMTPDELLHYVQLGMDGVYYFGLPDRSDDILDCRPETLLRFLKLLRKLSDRKESNFSVLIAIEGLPFHTLRILCPHSEQLHVLMPDDSFSDRSLAEWEIHKLFSMLPPSLLKFISEPQRTIT